jgi:hypothetical protein
LMPAKYDFYEKVRVMSSAPSRAQINGELCAVLGQSYGADNKWHYTVHVYRLGLTWTVPEDELVATGEYDCRDTFYSGDSIRVRVDEHGHGSVVDDE